MTWFEKLFGFAEAGYAETQARLVVEGDRLRSLANGRSFGIGTFTTPTLQELRERAAPLARPGELRLFHVPVGDILETHAEPQNRGALFQVASQFNCLEFATADAAPELGVTCYAWDRTQGPACSLAAAAATVYRNYFAPVGTQRGQTETCQIDNLDALAESLGGRGRYWDVTNGYTSSSPERLLQLREESKAHDREALLGQVKVGLHHDVEVTFARRFEAPEGEPPIVSQAFCSACSCSYSTMDAETWRPLATLALDAAYEATLWAAAENATRPGGSNVVWLTFLGGGAFGNPQDWIVAAIARAVNRLRHVDLDVRLAHYRRVDPQLASRIDAAVRSDGIDDGTR